MKTVSTVGSETLGDNGLVEAVQQDADSEVQIKTYLGLCGQIAGKNHNLTTAKSTSIAQLRTERSVLLSERDAILKEMNDDAYRESQARLAQKESARRAKVKNGAASAWQAMHDSSLLAALTAANVSSYSLDHEACLSEAIRIAQSRSEEYWDHLPIDIKGNAKLRYMQVFVDGIAAVYETEIAISGNSGNYRIQSRYNVVVNDTAEGFYFVGGLANAKLQDVRLFLAAEQLIDAIPDPDTGVITVGKEYLRTKVA